MGYNFIPRREDGINVIRDKIGNVIKIIAQWEGIEVPWSKVGKKIIADKKTFNPLPLPIRNDMRRQVRAIFNCGINKKAEAKKNKKKLQLISQKYLSKIDKTRLEILRKNGIEYLTRGWIRIRHWTNVERNLIITPKIVKDINAAIRMQKKHILAGYKGNSKQKGEIAELESIKKTIREVNDLFANWVKSDSQRPDIIQGKLATAFSRLINCHNELKIASADNIAEAIPLEDRLGRVNPGAKATITVAAINRLDDRSNQLRIIIPIIALRQELLIFEKNWMETQVKQACLYLKSVLHRPKDHFQNRISDIDQKINQSIYILDTMWPSPFFEKAQKSKDYLLEAKKYLQVKRTIEAKKIINSSIKILQAK